jgi:glutathione peroxidase
MLIQCAKSCHGAKKEAAQILEQLAGIDSFFQLSANDITGKPFDFSALAGQVTVLTNVASYCGYTESHYHGLVELYSAVADAPVTILAFPCNQFGQQEPGSAADIQEFAASKGVKFQLMEKINVNGPDAHLVYKYLKYHTGTTAVTWNFATYFVVSPDGTTVQAYHGTEPMELLPTVLELAGSSSEL